MRLLLSLLPTLSLYAICDSVDMEVGIIHELIDFYHEPYAIESDLRWLDKQYPQAEMEGGTTRYRAFYFDEPQGELTPIFTERRPSTGIAFDISYRYDSGAILSGSFKWIGNQVTSTYDNSPPTFDTNPEYLPIRRDYDKTAVERIGAATAIFPSGGDLILAHINLDDPMEKGDFTTNTLYGIAFYNRATANESVSYYNSRYSISTMGMISPSVTISPRIGIEVISGEVVNRTAFSGGFFIRRPQVDLWAPDEEGGMASNAMTKAKTITNISYAPITDDGLVESTITTSFWGVGLQLGGKISMMMADCCSIFGDGSFSLLAGESSGSSILSLVRLGRQRGDELEFPDRLPPGNSKSLTDEVTLGRVIPAFKSTIGIKCSRRILCNSLDNYLKLAVDSSYYWQPFTRIVGRAEEYCDEFYDFDQVFGNTYGPKVPNTLSCSNDNYLALFGLLVEVGVVI